MFPMLKSTDLKNQGSVLIISMIFIAVFAALAVSMVTMSGNATLKGVIYIETPNVVEFTGGADVTGIIVGDGDLTDNSGVNQLKFIGNVESHPISKASLKKFAKKQELS